MRTLVSAKQCPECGKAAALQTSFCSVCGHRFRTRFAEPPIEMMEPFSLSVAPPPLVVRPPRRTRPSRTFRLALGCFLLAALTGGLLCLGWSVRQPAAVLPLQPAVLSPASVTPALHLYQAIKPAMSLYDLDKAAGGTGRVVRTSDPHVLLVFYKYPHQSVQVSLSRTDLASRDYQVQAVSLYQGKVLLQRHTSAE